MKPEASRRIGGHFAVLFLSFAVLASSCGSKPPSPPARPASQPAHTPTSASTGASRPSPPSTAAPSPAETGLGNPIDSPAAPRVTSPPVAAQQRCLASYTINVTVTFSSTITQGQNRIMVELRQGTPGASKVVDTKHFEGQTATVGFSQMCAGSYFIAIGNGDSVAVGPVRQFSDGQSVRTNVRVTQSSGNVGTRSRSGL